MTDATAFSDSTDPIAIVFPGQGSQAPGMGKLVYDTSPAARLDRKSTRLNSSHT